MRGAGWGWVSRCRAWRAMARSGAAQYLFAALARGGEAGGVGLGARVAGQADQGDLVQRPVGLSVAAAVESVAVGPPGGWRGSGRRRTGRRRMPRCGFGRGCRRRRRAGWRWLTAQRLGGEHRRGGAGGQCAQLGVDVGDLVGQDLVAADPGGAVSAWSSMRGRWAVGAGRVRARAPMSPLAAETGEAGAHGVGGGGQQGGDLPVGDGRGPSSRCGARPGAPGSVRRGRCRSWPRAGRRPRPAPCRRRLRL